MPRVPVASDLSPARLDPHSRSPAQLDRSAIAALGAANARIGNAIAAVGSAFGEVAARAGAAQDAQNYASAKLEWLKGDAGITTDIQSNVGEDGALWQSAPERYAELNKGIDERFPISNPAKRRDFEMWREMQTFQRGMTAAKAYQGAQRGLFLRGFEQDIAGVEGRIAQGEIDPTSFGELHSALTEKLDGMDNYVLSRSEVEAKKREINSRLMLSFDAFLRKKDPDAADSFWEQVRKGNYEIDQPGFAQPERQSQGPIGPLEFRQPPLERKVGRPRTSEIKGVVLHQTWGSDTMEGNGSWSNKKGTGANYYIDKEGRVYQWAPDDVAMAHVGKGRNHANNRRPDLTNDNTIGIEIMTRPNERPNEKQVAAARALVMAKAQEHGFTPDDVFGHGELTNPNHRRADEAIEAVNAIRGTGQPQNDNQPTRVASLGSTANDATLAEDAPAPEQAEFAQLAALAQQNPDTPVTEALSAEQIAALRERVVDSGSLEGAEFDEMLGRDLTVGEAVEVAQGALEGSGLSTQEAAAMFTEATQPSGRNLAPEQPFPGGRLVGGQSFTVKTKRGEFSIPSEWLNSIDGETRKAFAARAREAARIAQKDREIIADQMMADQLAHVEQFGTDAPGYDVAGIRAVYRNNPKKVDTHLRKVEAARHVAELMQEAPKLRDDDLEQRLEALRPREGSRDVADQMEAYEAAQKRVEKLLEQRRKDPAAAVESTPAVQAVREALPDGRPQNQAQSFQIVNARLNAQRLLQIAPQNQKPLTNAEAKTLAEPLRNISEGNAERALNDLAADVEKRFGRKYSGLIMRQLVETAFNEKERRGLLADLLRSMDESGQVAPTDLDRAREMFRVRKMEKALAPSSTDEAAPEQPGWFSRLFGGTPTSEQRRTAPMGAFGRAFELLGPSEPQAPRRTPPRNAIDHLKKNPGTLPAFEKTFGLNPGEGRQYLLK